MASNHDRPKILLVHRTAVKRQHDGKFLVVKRSPHDHHNAGLWEFPGGKVEKGQNLHEAARVEVLQETSLLVQIVMPDVTFTEREIVEGVYKGFKYLALFSIAKVIGGRIRLSSEHTHHQWLTYRQMLSLDDLTLEVREAAIALEKPMLEA